MANRYSNDYNDQDYPRYYDRDDRYDSQSEGRNSSRLRNEQRNQAGSGRENTQGGAYDYNESERQRNETKFERSGGGDKSQNNPRDYDDFASTSRSSRNYNDQSRRNARNDQSDYTLYGYDRDMRHADRSGDSGGYGERTRDYQNQNYNYSGGSYARSDDRQQQNREHGGSSRYYGNQDEQSRSNQSSDRQNYGGANKSGQSFYGKDSGYSGSSESGFDYQRSDDRLRDRNQNNQERGWWERTTDEVASWFGDDEAERRRANDTRSNDYNQYQTRAGEQTSHRGRGPKNYRRSDERIKEEINDRLTDYAYLDASDIEVEISNGEVILAGTVESRYAKRMAEDIAENVSGVNHLENRLRVKQANNQAGYSQISSATDNLNSLAQTSPKASDASDTSGTYGSPEDLAANYSNQGLSEVSPIGKPVTGDLTGSRNFTGETSNSNDDSNVGVMAAQASTGATTSNSEISGDFDSSSTFSQRGVDKLSDSTK